MKKQKFSLTFTKKKKKIPQNIGQVIKPEIVKKWWLIW